MEARAGREAPDRNLALELVRVTEAAAMAAARKMGFGDKEAVDQAAVAMAELWGEQVGRFERTAPGFQGAGAAARGGQAAGRLLLGG